MFCKFGKSCAGNKSNGGKRGGVSLPVSHKKEPPTLEQTSHRRFAEAQVRNGRRRHTGFAEKEKKIFSKSVFSLGRGRMNAPRFLVPLKKPPPIFMQARNLNHLWEIGLGLKGYISSCLRRSSWIFFLFQGGRKEDGAMPEPICQDYAAALPPSFPPPTLSHFSSRLEGDLSVWKSAFSVLITKNK